jgi:NAD(P)H dehydrogenase (quinone)
MMKIMEVTTLCDCFTMVAVTLNAFTHRRSGRRVNHQNNARTQMKILIVYYSLYGHVFKLAQAVKEGAESVKGAEVLFRRVEEFDIVLKKTADDNYLNQVRGQQKDIPVCTLDDLRAADGVIFGSPTRYGNMTAQMKQLIDSTASLWLKGEMEGKPAGVFTSTASTHGGQETTLLTMMVPLLHLGMLIVGVPYSVEGMLHTEGRGGTPYGATTIAGGQGELQPKPEDLAIARALGRRVAEITARVRG